MVEWVQIGDARLACGDCRAVLPTLGKVDAVVTDPPYGMGKDIANDTIDEADAVTSSAIEWCKENVSGNVIAFWSAQRWHRVPELFFPAKRVMIWHKGFAPYAPHNVGYRYELIVWVKGDRANDKRGDVFEAFPIAFRTQAENAAHPTQKPVDLLTEILRDFTSPDTAVLDPFMGSGTTGVACAKLGRKFIGVEIERRYFDIACRRIEAAYAQPDMFISRAAPEYPQEPLL